jgi:hypothetical protein
MVVSSNEVRTLTVLADGWCDRTAAALATPVGRRASAANVSPSEVKVIYGAASFPLRPRECDLLVTLLNQRLTLRRTGIPKPSGPVPSDSVAVTHPAQRELARVSTGPVLSITPASEQGDSGEKAFTPTGRQVSSRHPWASNTALLVLLRAFNIVSVRSFARPCFGPTAWLSLSVESLPLHVC